MQQILSEAVVQFARDAAAVSLLSHDQPAREVFARLSFPYGQLGAFSFSTFAGGQVHVHAHKTSLAGRKLNWEDGGENNTGPATAVMKREFHRTDRLARPLYFPQCLLKGLCLRSVKDKLIKGFVGGLGSRPAIKKF